MESLIDIHLEKDIVAYLVEHPHETTDAEKIFDSESISNKALRNVYLTCVELSQTSNTFTRSEIFRLLKQKYPNGDYSSVLKLRPDRVISLSDTCFELMELASKRKMYDFSSKIQQMINEKEETDVVQNFISSFDSSGDNTFKTKAVVPIGEVYSQAIDSLMNNAGKTKFAGVTTGSRKLNYILGGWKAGMYIVAARPSMGKTIVGLDFAKKAALEGASTLFFSLEMPADQLMYRYISSEYSDVSYSNLSSYRVTPEQVREIVKSDADKLKGLPYHFYDADNRDINYIINIIISEVRKNKIELVIIDYLQLLRDAQLRDSSEFAQVSSVSSKIQQVAKKLKIPIIVLSQLSREVEKRTNKRPMLSDLRSSGQIEQDASCVIALFRPHYYAVQEAREKGEKEPELDTTLELIVLKQRNGATGTVVMNCDVMTNRLADSEEELFRFTNHEVISTSINKIESDFTKTEEITPF